MHLVQKMSELPFIAKASNVVRDDVEISSGSRSGVRFNVTTSQQRLLEDLEKMLVRTVDIH